MIVVSDTSPILNLQIIEHLDLLPRLYGEVVIPRAVADELTRDGYPKLDAEWLVVRVPSNMEIVARYLETLDKGEAEAIALAKELHADLLLIDERQGWRFAVAERLETTGLLGVLAEAKKAGLILECEPIIAKLVGNARFWLSPQLKQRFLKSVGEGQ